MYRSGWATKPNQDSYDAWKEQLQNAPVRIRWDPERDIQMNKLDYQSIQMGLSDLAVKKYTEEWIVNITDVTSLTHVTKSLLESEQACIKVCSIMK